MADSLDHAPAQANNLPQFLALTVGANRRGLWRHRDSPLYAFREALRPFWTRWRRAGRSHRSGFAGTLDADRPS